MDDCGYRRLYRFPPLAECRANFCEMLQQNITWSEPQEWQIGFTVGIA
jgi:hypothetical protein